MIETKMTLSQRSICRRCWRVARAFVVCPKCGACAAQPYQLKLVPQFYEIAPLRAKGTTNGR